MAYDRMHGDFFLISKLNCWYVMGLLAVLI